MKREVVKYTSPEQRAADRAKDITSTTVSAIFGLSPYLTRFELWHRLHGEVAVAAVDNERTRWGNRLQAAIASGVADEQGWQVEPIDDYMRLPSEQIGASFDFGIRTPEGLLECKNVDGLEFKRGWHETDFGLEAPPHIEIQVQHQMLVSGIAFAYIAALIGGNRLELLLRRADPELHEAILHACAAFWASAEPEPDFHRDAAFIGRLYGYSAPGSTLEADDELAALFREYAGHRATAKTASDNVDAAKAAILRKIGDAERVTHESFTLSTKMVKDADIAYHREAYRGFRLTERKA